MEFADQVLLRLADPAAREALFDEAALDSVLRATYDLVDVGGPYAPTFEQLSLGFRLEAPQRVAGTVVSSTGTRHELGLTVETSDRRSPLDALWVGSVVARASVPNDLVIAVTSAVPVATGGPPISLGVDMNVTFAAPQAPPDVARPFPVAVAVMTRNVEARLRDVLADAAVSRAGVVAAGASIGQRDDLPRVRNHSIALWITPAVTFDDAGWPGGGAGTADEQRVARRARAASWLADQGIALAAVELP